MKHWFMRDRQDPEYVKDFLIRLQHVLRKLTDQPHKHTIPLFGATIKYAIPVRKTVEEMDHKQTPTPIQTDNTAALGFITKNLHPKATK